MLVCLWPVTLALVAALAFDGCGAIAVPEKRFLGLRPVDPLTRRSPMDKNFMRFGRAFDCLAAPVAAKRRDPGSAIGRRVDSNFIRFGRRDSNFIRFGRGEVYTPGDNKIPRRYYDVDVDGLEVRFGRSAGNAAANVPVSSGAAAAVDRSGPPFTVPSSYDRRRRR